MKRIWIYLFLATTIVACSKDEINYERPDAKLNRLKAEYLDLLTGADKGWIGYLFPEGGGGYTFKFTFDENNRVVTYASIDEEKANAGKESSYRIKADQVLSLYFDTYTYLHILSDPDPNKSGGSTGAGLISDFEFAILESGQDTIKLKGNHNDSELLLVRAKSDQGDDYIARAYEYVKEVDKVNQFTYYYNKFVFNGKNYAFTVNTEKSTISFYYEKNGTFNRFTTEYAVADNGVLLRHPFEDGEMSISSLTDFATDQVAGTVDLKVNSSASATIENVDAPVFIDKDAPRRMYVESYDYYSSTGANYSGVKDALDIRSIPGFAGMYFMPRYYIDPYDVLFTYFNGGANFVGPYFRTSYDNSGVMKFIVTNLTGTSPGAAHLPKIQTLSSLWADTDGYYVYQTGENYFDLVSVADSKLWFRFY